MQADNEPGRVLLRGRNGEIRAELIRTGAEQSLFLYDGQRKLRVVVVEGVRGPVVSLLDQGGRPSVVIAVTEEGPVVDIADEAARSCISASVTHDVREDNGGPPSSSSKATDATEPSAILRSHDTHSISLKAESRRAAGDTEARLIRRVLADSGWKKSQAAQLLGISRPTLDAKIEQYGIERDDRGVR